MKERVVVIDDDIEFLELIRTWLENAGYEALTAENGIEGLRRVYSSHPNLVLLDGNMPRMDGWELCRRIRDMTDIPIIMVTINGQTRDLLKGFDLGVDDYVTKPVDLNELMARIRAVLRRSQSTTRDEESSVFHGGDLVIDWKSHQIYVRGKQVKLSPTEFRVLSCLTKNQGWVVTHNQLLQKAWGADYIGDKSFVKLYVRYLRQKIERDPHKPELILTERGVGYRFSIQEKHAKA
ncbi:MAG TPA: response regulator transcription factor [Dehalococcoidia bacterium]|nr:response regulator transcription factor [Dehalococcoidia bacterium]